MLLLENFFQPKKTYILAKNLSTILPVNQIEATTRILLTKNKNLHVSKFGKGVVVDSRENYSYLKDDGHPILRVGPPK